jgi:WD40-like Beta Propeller Repeat
VAFVWHRVVTCLLFRLRGLRLLGETKVLRWKRGTLLRLEFRHQLVPSLVGSNCDLPPARSDLKKLATFSGSVDLLGWSPDGAALVGDIIDLDASDLHTIHVINGDGSGSRPLGLDFDPTLYGGSWRPDGRHIALRTSHGVFIADADGTNIRQLPIGPVGLLSALEWSPDARHLSFGMEGPGDVDQINIADIDEDGRLTQLRKLRMDPKSSDESRAKWSPDGSRLAFLLRKDGAYQVGIVHPDGSGHRLVGPELISAGLTYTWSPDGRSLIIVTGHDVDGKTWSVDVATGEQTEVQMPVESWQRLAP